MDRPQVKKSYGYPLGTVMRSTDGEEYTIQGFLGRGGQGEVYRVSSKNGEFALKWYHPEIMSKIRAEDFYQNLARNVKRGIPALSSGDQAMQFVWPLKLMEARDGSFGYIMRLFLPGYEPLQNVYMLRKMDATLGRAVPIAWNSWFTRVTAGLNIVRAFEILHANGYSYQDLNDGGISINMNTGDVLICDCDNVSPDKVNLGIKGVMTYMAPEVITGKKLPDRLTDQYSLAVILFRLFLHGHPMNGVESRSLHNSDQISQRDADMQIYGYQPHYCLARQDNPNPPDRQYNWDVYRYCWIYPRVLMEAFDRVFTEGIEHWEARLTATEWRNVLVQVRDDLVLVNGKEEFLDLILPKSLPEACRVLKYPTGRKVYCMPGKILYQCHLSAYSPNFSEPVAKIIPTNRPEVIGLYNHTGKEISCDYQGKTRNCPPEGRIPLIQGMKLWLGKEIIEVE